MAARRGRGEGGVGKKKRPDGSVMWYATFTDPRYGTMMPDGRRNRHYVYGASKADVIRARAEKLGGLQAGFDPTDETLRDYLDRWLGELRVANAVKPNTLLCYSDTVARYIAPHLGSVAVSKLTPAHVSYLLGELAKAGKSERVRELSYAVLRTSLKRALAQDRIQKDPFRGVEKPRVTKKDMLWWTDDQVAAFLGATKNSPRYALYVVALRTGMRQGEMLGLQWTDVDFQNGVIHVRKGLIEQEGKIVGRHDPKTEAGKRTIVMSPEVRSVLLEHRARALTSLVWVFPNSKGGPQLKSKLVQAFHREAEAAGVPVIRFHDLRHTYAMWALRRGMDAKTLQEIMGHSDVATTLSKYTHRDMDRQRSVVARIAGEEK